MRGAGIRLVVGLAALVLGCDGAGTSGAGGAGGGGGGGPPDAGTKADSAVRTGVALGTGITTVVAMGLSVPRDLAFNPMRPKELWVVTAGDNATTIVHDAPEPGRRSERRADPARGHFMDKPTAIAFGAEETNPNTPGAAEVPGTFATCNDSRNGGNDFMGPVLWSSDLVTFALRNGMLGSHLDMLHMSPLCTGLAWHGAGNVYWTISGTRRAIVKYDFHLDHGLGNDNHEDGEIWRFAAGEIGYQAGVPSGLVYRPEDQMLYIADTGNGRVARLDTSAATPGPMRCLEPLVTCAEMTGAVLTDVVAPGTLERPSGLELYEQTLIVADHATSKVHTFTLSGQPQRSVQLELPPGSLGGIAVGPDKKVYVADLLGGQVLRLEP